MYIYIYIHTSERETERGSERRPRNRKEIHVNVGDVAENWTARHAGEHGGYTGHRGSVALTKTETFAFLRRASENIGEKKNNNNNDIFNNINQC